MWKPYATDSGPQEIGTDAHADRSRVVRPLQRSARSFCAENYDSGDSPCRASPHAGRITPRPVWVPVGAAPAAPVRRRADAERSGQPCSFVRAPACIGSSGRTGPERSPSRRQREHATQQRRLRLLTPSLKRSVHALLKTAPRAYGWCRTRWSCATLAVEVQVRRGIRGVSGDHAPLAA